MTNHEKFLDAMNGVDEKFLSVHIRKKCPTAADKVKRYSMAAVIYAAAIVAVAVLLPFIIRHGEDPAPQPGNDPVAVETNVTESRDTETTDNLDPEMLPTESITFNGCEFSITLDKAHYDLDDTITATVVLENKGDETIGLYQAYIGNYLNEVLFCEWNNVRASYSSDYDKGYPEAEQWCMFKPGDRISHTVSFTPGSPRDPGEDPAESYSDWSIWAFLSYYTDTDAEEPGVEEVEPICVTVEVPHGNGEYVTADVTTVPPETTPEVTTTPPPETTTTTAPPPPPETTTTTPPPETTSEAPPPATSVVTTAAPLVPVDEDVVHVHYGYNNPEGWDNISEPYSPRPKETYITFCNCVLKITIDKTNYLKSDTKAVVTVTLRNNGSQSIGLRQSLIYYGYPMDDKSHLIDDVKFSDGKRTAVTFSEGFYARYGLIQPYETITHTEEVDLSIFDYDAPWTVTATVHFIPEPTMDNGAFPTEEDAAKVRTAVLKVELPHTDPPPPEYPYVEYETDMERYSLALDKTHYTQGDVIDATMSLEKFEGNYDVLWPFHDDRYLLDYLEFYEDGVLQESYRIPYDNGFEIKDYYEFYRGDKVNFKALFSTENASPDSKWVIRAGFRIGMSFNLTYIEIEVPHD